jgi:class 3 adenylate cyclase
MGGVPMVRRTRQRNTIEVDSDTHTTVRRKLADLDLVLYQNLLDSLATEGIDRSAMAAYLVKRQELRPQFSVLESEINKLKAEIDQSAKTLLEQKVDVREKDKHINELKSNLEALRQKEGLSHLISRVGSSAQKKLLSSEEFRALFSQDVPCNAYVLSIDIRRSTELMLKARDPKLYAHFVITLARQLREVILENYGVFDKFTGDGVLAFFPTFYSGEDAGFYALRAAKACHEVFNSLYQESKHCFVSILQEIGLGIGIDYGLVQIVQIGGDFTVVGTPVVYACRMGGAEAGQTFVNQPAYEMLFDSYSAVCDFDACEITVKHEGKTLAYGVEFNGKPFPPKLPDWDRR